MSFKEILSGIPNLSFILNKHQHLLKCITSMNKFSSYLIFSCIKVSFIKFRNRQNAFCGLSGNRCYTLLTIPKTKRKEFLPYYPLDKTTNYPNAILSQLD